jgi:hypothetical protein
MQHRPRLMSWLARVLVGVLIGAALVLTVQAQTTGQPNDQATPDQATPDTGAGQPAADAQDQAVGAAPQDAAGADASAVDPDGAPLDGEVPTGTSPGRFIPREQLSQDLGASFPVDI